ncbi:MAG: membrane dipeptidase [Myxococcales bacterium]|nr:membrane dipeptidase [Myxococcales bacterium]
MRTLLAAILLVAACGGGDVATETPAPEEAAESIEARALRLAKETLIIDGHVDLPYRLHHMATNGEPMPDLSVHGEKGDFDAARAKAGGLDAPFMSIYIPAKHQKEGGAKALADSLIDNVEGLIEKWPGEFAKAHSPAQVQANFEGGRISLLLGIENGAALEDDIANVKHFFDRGVRYITLTHGKDNLICDSSYADTNTWGGMSDYGRKVVAEMNRLGILVDISHVDDETFFEVMKISSKPVIASHSSLRHFTPGFERNMSDDMVRALAENGGVVMINFGSTFISRDANEWRSSKMAEQERFSAANKDAPAEAADKNIKAWYQENPLPFATTADVGNHIDRVVQLVGIEHTGLGSDFDGVGNSLPVGLKDASGYPGLIQNLLERGYSDQDIAKLCSGNLLRVWLAQNNSR